ncbi:phosphotransferase family protein [Myxococcota bacterium]|nr:phosphotransferase family protein [Myxococcota bacterium]
MPQPKGRDLQQTAGQLQRWLAAQLPRAEDIAVRDLRGPKDTGFSSDTLMFSLDRTEQGERVQREMVVRLEPLSEFGVFPEYDAPLQFRMMKALQETAVPVPQMHWLEEDPGPLGSPFYVMERVDALVPSDSPPYHAQGWVADASPDERERLWYSGLDAMAQVHRLDLSDHRFDFLIRPNASQTAIHAQLAYWQRYIDWGIDRNRYRLIARGLDWLIAHAPAEEPVGICWGDARISNQLFRDFRCVAVIDWEMVFVGNPEADLAWFIVTDRAFTEGLGLSRLPGFPDASATRRRWEEQVGRPAGLFTFYEIFAAWRFAVIMARVFQQMKHYEAVPEDSDIDQVNFTTPVLEAVLDAVGA